MQDILLWSTATQDILPEQVGNPSTTKGGKPPEPERGILSLYQ